MGGLETGLVRNGSYCVPSLLVVRLDTPLLYAGASHLIIFLINMSHHRNI